MPLQEQLEQFRSRFMAACGTGKAPAIHSFLAELPQKDHVAAMELLIPLEIQFRLENGHHPVVADYANLGSAGVDIANRVIESLIQPTQTVTSSDVQGQTLIGSASKMSQHVPLTQSLVLDSFQKATDFGEISPVIGPYKILQKIAEGGMGIVFMARRAHRHLPLRSTYHFR